MKRMYRLAMVGTIVVVALAAIWMRAGGAYALPEYAERTGEPCATCHVNPGGGGPRTLRGLLWAARGRPDQVPALPNVLLAPGVMYGRELYERACAACHGLVGEGLYGRELAYSGLKAAKIRSNILTGRVKSGMPPFDGRFTDEQLQRLVEYVAAMANGELEPQPEEYPLPPPELTCTPQASPDVCGGNR